MLRSSTWISDSSSRRYRESSVRVVETSVVLAAARASWFVLCFIVRVVRVWISEFGAVLDGSVRYCYLVSFSFSNGIGDIDEGVRTGCFG